jgi:hypothetical protein
MRSGGLRSVSRGFFIHPQFFLWQQQQIEPQHFQTTLRFSETCVGHASLSSCVVGTQFLGLGFYSVFRVGCIIWIY